VLALGHNVFYSGPKFSPDQPPRWPIFAVWREGHWGPRRKLAWDDPRGAYIYTNNCGQRVGLPNGDILLAFSHGAVKNKPRSVSSVICAYDGEALSVKQVGEEIRHEHGRGLLEPSLVRYGGRFWLTLRAEDNHGYVCTGEDGLKWTPKQAWAWDDGEPITMSTTQQHWLPHSDGLYLAYTRKAPGNENVARWRTPLFMARVDEQRGRLLRETERIVLPQRGDGGEKGYDAWLSGNFHATILNANESIITDGQINPARGYIGDVLMARIRWKSPNRLAKY
jgi:hypothetical protein